MNGWIIAFIVGASSTVASWIFAKIAEECFKDKREWATLRQLYRLHRGKDAGFFCTAFTGVFSLMNYIFIDGRFFRVGGVIKNGYALVCLSPLVLVYWVIICLAYVLLWECGLVALILACIWAALFEGPADVLNAGNGKQSLKTIRRRVIKAAKGRVIGELGVAKRDKTP